MRTKSSTTFGQSEQLFAHRAGGSQQITAFRGATLNNDDWARMSQSPCVAVAGERFRGLAGWGRGVVLREEPRARGHACGVVVVAIECANRAATYSWPRFWARTWSWAC